MYGDTTEQRNVLKDTLTIYYIQFGVFLLIFQIIKFMFTISVWGKKINPMNLINGSLSFNDKPVHSL